MMIGRISIILYSLLLCRSLCIKFLNDKFRSVHYMAISWIKLKNQECHKRVRKMWALISLCCLHLGCYQDHNNTDKAPSRQLLDIKFCRTDRLFRRYVTLKLQWKVLDGMLLFVNRCEVLRQGVPQGQRDADLCQKALKWLANSLLQLES